MSCKILMSLLFACCTLPAQAVPIAITIAGDTYNQNFNFPDLARSGSSTVLPTGWAISTPTYSADTGSSSSGGARSYGSTIALFNARDDRALGSLTSDAVPTVLFGAEFQNTSSRDFTSLTISYTGEQWRQAANSRLDTLYFTYSLDATSLLDPLATWISVSLLDFISPQPRFPLLTFLPATPLPGNLGINQSFQQATLNNLLIPIGSTFWIRFQDDNISGQDHGLAVDNFSLTAIPEPSSLLLLASAAFLLPRRRR